MDWLTRPGAATAPSLVDIARAASGPAPSYEMVAEVDASTVAIQERLPGVLPATVDRLLVDILACCE